jgi:hypothetical protein
MSWEAAHKRRDAEIRWKSMSEAEKAADRARRRAERPAGRLRSSLMTLAREQERRS